MTNKTTIDSTSNKYVQRMHQSNNYELQRGAEKIQKAIDNSTELKRPFEDQLSRCEDREMSRWLEKQIRKQDNEISGYEYSAKTNYEENKDENDSNECSIM